MVKREYYEGIVDLFPPGLFGNLAFDGVCVLSPNDGFYSYEVINAILYGEELPSPNPTDSIEIGLSQDATGYSLIGNKMTIRIIETFPGMARTMIEAKARQFVRKLSLVTGKPIAYSIKNISQADHGEINPTEYKCIPYAVYDRKEMTRAIAKVLTELEGDDGLLTKSMDYFRLGELFLNIWGMLHSDEHLRHDMDWKLGNALIGTAYLHFWKSITTITEELGSTESEARLKALRLGKKTKKILRALKALRNDFDIAHRNYDSTAISEPRHFINVIEGVARTVIEQYVGYSKRTGSVFDCSQVKVKRKYESSISLLEKEYETISRSKLDFGWAISKSETTNR
ncbi:MAG: hypothetical protein ACYDAP_12090 [Thermoplasmataceae archaeon]